MKSYLKCPMNYGIKNILGQNPTKIGKRLLQCYVDKQRLSSVPPSEKNNVGNKRSRRTKKQFICL